VEGAFVGAIKPGAASGDARSNILWAASRATELDSARKAPPEKIIRPPSDQILKNARALSSLALTWIGELYDRDQRYIPDRHHEVKRLARRYRGSWIWDAIEEAQMITITSANPKSAVYTR